MEANEIMRDYAGSMSAVENHLLEAIERQAGDANFARYGDVLLLLQRIKGTLKEHLSWLDNYLDSIGGGAKTEIKKAASSITGAISGVYGKIMREDSVSRSMRDDYVLLTLIGVSYSMLQTTALALTETAVADVALRHMNEIVPFAIELNRMIPSVVNQELAEENKTVDSTVWKLATEKSQEAWRNAACEQHGVH